ncbi:hypothetical protein [Leptospira interrogans]|uniref:Uncharacterized protein n=1 Tax=Leptospira interrogans str. FPW1039 TaxID=1193040 RepID=A0A0F6I803_LEPIR|nr:hypothetical protein [Leptospira interrogans]EKR80507.1 hypothetical protein LEP1GSC099_0256 [Leptospira interrogans str. UI 08452]EMJ34178.1 hypothetical protein LEP1GSC079_1909 [Leptospira interrogans str. FPW1039]EMN35297.1 hypothetical protein LEP1GSC084_2768 [Leptospira interrogans serovar Medanensis str. L0448]EMN42255.1 hypothetical protein LEP1GSC085_2040 [Leptospira interrogans str. L0996]EMN96979.1 hypothetical protein LEP1GSC110_4698 [Leptospira interrogans serovar Medanensis str
MNRLFFVFFLFLFLNQSIKAETYTITEIKRFLRDPAIVEKYWLLESIPVWQKEEESRLEIYLKKILSTQLQKQTFPKKEILKTEFKKVPNLGGIRIRNQKSTLFSLKDGFPNLSQIRSFKIQDYYIDFYLGRQIKISPVEFLKAGLVCSFYYFSEDETLLYSQESSEWKIATDKTLGELNSFFKLKSTSCKGCEKIRLANGTLFFFPSQLTIAFWIRLGIGILIFIFALVLTFFFFLSFWIRNRETLRKAIQAQKTLDQEKKSILSQ